MLIEQFYRKFSGTTILSRGFKKPARQPDFYSDLHKVFPNKLNWVVAIAIVLWLPVSGQTTLISSTGVGGFESGTTFATNGWTTVMSANPWFLGTTVAGYSGARGAFIGTASSNNNYLGVSAHSHFYRDVVIPANQPNLTLTFKVKCGGNSGSNLTVYLAPTTYTPTTASTPSFTYIIGSGTGYYNYASYTTITINLNCWTTGSQRIIFSWNNGSTVNNPAAAIDDISLVASGCGSYSGTGYVYLSSLPYLSTARNTCGKVDDFTSANTVTCGAAGFLGGEDEIFEFTPTASGALTITMSNASSSSSAMMLYQGCPSTSVPCGGGSCLAYNQNSTTSKLICASVVANTTYFLLVDAVSGCYTYDISITAPGAAIPNDLPCGATAVTLGTMTMDDNTCATGTGEPGTPGCWTVGNLNSLWYSFVAPSSGAVHVGILTGSLITAQIELLSGTCSSLTSVSGTCQDYNNMRCPGATYTGLTSGTTYYIRVDGYNNDVGSFGIVVDNNSGILTPMSTDANGAVEICSFIYNAPANSIGCGNVADVPAAGNTSNPNVNPNCCNAGCLLSGELNPRWFRINIATSGTLAWTLSCPMGGFFDWEMWNITNSSTGAIAGNTLAPVRCNWNASSSGSTGMESPAPMGLTGNYQAPLSVSAGETFILCITNWSYITTSAYTLDFSNSTCTLGGSTSTWDGYGGTSWSAAGSWSGCQGVPTCNVNAVVNPGASQPVISSSASTKDLIINAGSTLTINAGVTLTVCGNFTNNGTLSISPTATILFSGTGTQNISGLVTGTNKLGNVTITKSSGSVVATVDIDIAGTFTTSNSTSIFNANSKYIKLAGHFTNSLGGTTFTNVGTGTLEFNGAANQNYSPGGTLTLKNVRMNQSTTSTVTLAGSNMIFGGTLTLTNGRISTGSYEVNATSTATASVTAGNTNSYVDGNLRRSVGTTGSYDFPVGDFASGKGYQRANINFTSSSNVTDLLAKFQPYASIPAALGVTDCANTYNMPGLDNGYWTITSTPTMTSGAYTATLFNTAGTYTNSGGASNWTVMKDDGSGWFITGTCAGSTVNQVVRTAMSGFSLFGTAQSSTVLPIELTSFTGAVVSTGNWLQWITAAELNNNYFIVEKSLDAMEFSELLKVNGAGTSKLQHTYEGYDFNPINGINYYRLRQVDFDGHSTYSDMIALRNYSQSEIVTSITPNPTTGDINIEVRMPVDAVMKIEVLNIFGTVMNSLSSVVKEGSNSIPASLNVKESGIYLLRITCDDVGYSYQTKVVKY